MIVDDEPINLSVLTQILSSSFLIRAFKSASMALEKIKQGYQPSLILLDINMPEMSGYEFLDELKQDTSANNIPVIFISTLDTTLDETTGFEHGAVDYITKPFRPSIVLARIKVQLELKQARDILKDQNDWLEKEVSRRMMENQLIFDLSLDIITQLVETRDVDTGSHINRTKSYYEILMRQLKKLPKYQEIITESFIQFSVKASPMHDIGKVGIPDNILFKPGKLSDEEFEIIKTHTTIGYKAIQRALSSEAIIGLKESVGNLSASVFFQEASNIVYYHHERWDGLGYPKGLKGEQIPLTARVMGLVDVFDALTHKRVYKDAWSFQQTFDYIQQQSNKQFDPDVVDAFVLSKEKFELVLKQGNLYE